MAFFINDDCVVCMRCKRVCPVDAIWFDGDKIAIDNDKCIRCGKCFEICNLAAVVDTDVPPPVIIPHDVIRRSCDLLVIGGGGAGLVAAAKAAEQKGKRVVVLEKLKKTGGAAIYAMGIRLFSTKWDFEAGIPDQMDDYIRSAMNTTRWELNPQLIANSFRALPTFFNWFCTWGKPEELFALRESEFSPGRKTIELKKRGYMGLTAVMQKIKDRCTELGVEILTEYAATEFIMGDGGKITGVIASDPGGKTIFDCKVCLVATGNLNCSSLLARCVPDYARALHRRSAHRMPSATGDGVLMAEKAGIPVDYASICVAYLGPMAVPVEPQLSFQRRGETLNVNLNGERWCNETFGGGNVTWLLRQQPQSTYFSIMDSKIVSMETLPSVRILKDDRDGRNVAAGVPDPNGTEPVGQNFEDFGSPGMSRVKTDLKELKRIAALPGKHLIIADTIEELAVKMGVDKDVFAATVKRYNELCAKGHDDDFFKPAKYMLTVEHGPFYAFNFHMATDGGFGGLAVNENMQVMGGSVPIKGLYAAGDTTGSRYINRGGEKIEIINDMTWAIASGYLAGENIGKLLNSG
jgi:fumarate reductase flavoprotein subunit